MTFIFRKSKIRVALLLVGLAVVLLGPGAARTPAATPTTVVSLEFDDGDANQYQTDAMLAARGMHGTYFVNSGRIGSSSYMTKAQILQLQLDGNEIAGHTVSHADLPTFSTDEAIRQVCDDRTTLLADGFDVRNFAYPYGDYTAAVEQLVAGCNYNSARTIGGIRTPTSCNGCDLAESIPPLDVYATQTPDSLKANMSLAYIEGLVTQAEQHGGGWLQLVMHNVCDAATDPSCDAVYSISPTTLSSLLDWLQARAAQGTVVRTVQDVIGGPLRPGVAGPPAPPPGGGNLVPNPSLEETSGSLPTCWQAGHSGTNDGTLALSSDAHTGLQAAQVTITSFTSGDERLLSREDLGGCAPAAQSGHSYVFSAWYHSTAQVRLVAYLRGSSGAWDFWAQKATFSPASAPYTQDSWTTPAIPAGGFGTNGLSCPCTGMAVAVQLRSAGTFTADDLSLTDTDVVPPTVQLTSPADGSTISGTVTLSATADDASGIRKVQFLVDGSVVGTATGAPYLFDWDSNSSSDSTPTVTARAIDTAGNVADSSALVTIEKPTDTTAPSVNLTSPANGSTVAGPSVSLAATASDDVSVSKVEFSVDGSVIGTETSAPYQTNWDTSAVSNGSHTVTATAYDTSGNTATSSAMVTVQNADPQTYVSIEFDDGSTNQYQAYQMLANHGMHGTFFINSAEVGTSGFYMTWGQLHDISAAENEIGGHTLDHPDLTTLTTADQTHEVCDDRTNLQNQGFTVTDFAYPFGATNASVAQVVKNCGYDSGRLVDGIDESTAFAEKVPPSDAYATRTPENAQSTTSLQTLESYVTQAEQHGGGWVQLVFHQICDPNCDSDGYSTPPTELNALLDWLAPRSANGTVVRTVAQVMHASALPDKTPPSVALTAPSEGANVSGTTTLAATAGDDTAVAAVDFYVDGSKVGTSTTAPYQVQWNTDGAALGQHTIVATATDSSGNNSSTSPTSVTLVDVAVPTVSLTSPAAGASVSGVVSLTANAADNIAVSSVDFFVDGTKVGTDATSPYQVSWDTGGATIGQHTIVATATDSFGNKASTSGTSVTVADVTPPTVTLTSPADGSYVSGSITLAAKASDNVAVAGVDFLVDGVKLATDTVAPYSVSWNPSSAANGTHTIVASAVDKAGNRTSTAGVTVIVDKTAPTTTATCGNSTCGSSYSPTSVTLGLSASDNANGSGVAGTRYTTDGTTPTKASGTLYTGPISIASTTTIRFRSWDNAGNLESTKSVTVRVDSAAPQVAITAPKNGVKVVRGNVTISAGASDTGGSRVASVSFYVDGRLLGTDTNSKYAITWNTTNVTSGQHNLTAVAKDGAGNSTTSATVTVTV